VCIFSKVGWKTINFAKENKKGKNVGWQNFVLLESLFVSLFFFFFGGGGLVKL
jgi:hypothetical protein